MIFVYASQYSSFFVKKEIISTEDELLFEQFKKNKDLFKLAFKNVMGQNYNPSFSDLIKLYIFSSELATPEKKRNVIENLKKEYDLKIRAVTLFVFPIKFIEYYQPLIEENIFPFAPSTDNREKTRNEMEKSKQTFYVVEREGNFYHVTEAWDSENIVSSYKDLPQTLAYNITQFEVNNILDYYGLSQSVQNCLDSDSLKRVLRDKYRLDFSFYDMDFSTHSMDNNQYQTIRCIQNSPDGKIYIDCVGEGKYIILFLNRTYYSNPKFKAKKNKLARRALVKHIIDSIKI